jgi:hypothetical protein
VDDIERTAMGGQSGSVDNRIQLNSDYHYPGIQTIRTATKLITGFNRYDLLHLLGSISKKVQRI